MTCTQKQLEIQWNQYKQSIIALEKEIRCSGWEPDVIVCIGRGGMIAGEALSRLFKKPLGTIMTSSYTGEDEMTQGSLLIAEHISIAHPLHGKVLIVDDLVDSGKTLKGVYDKIQENFPEVMEVRSAVVYKKPCTSFAPTYYANIVENDLWLVFPNEIFDTLH